jgi:hypothetical protein
VRRCVVNHDCRGRIDLNTYTSFTYRKEEKKKKAKQREKLGEKS